MVEVEVEVGETTLETIMVLVVGVGVLKLGFSLLAGTMTKETLVADPIWEILDQSGAKMRTKVAPLTGARIK